MTEYIVVGAAIVLGLFVYGYITISGASGPIKEMKAVPVKAIAELAPTEARVRIIGVAREVGGQNVQAPQTGRIGVIALFERWQLATRHTSEKIIDRLDRKVPFAVEDASGSISVDVATADMRLVMEREQVASTVFGAGILAANAPSHTYEKEGVVMAGDTISVIGTVVRRPDGSLELTRAIVTNFPAVTGATT